MAEVQFLRVKVSLYDLLAVGQALALVINALQAERLKLLH